MKRPKRREWPVFCKGKEKRALPTAQPPAHARGHTRHRSHAARPRATCSARPRAHAPRTQPCTGVGGHVRRMPGCARSHTTPPRCCSPPGTHLGTLRAHTQPLTRPCCPPEAHPTAYPVPQGCPAAPTRCPCPGVTACPGCPNAPQPLRSHRLRQRGARASQAPSRRWPRLSPGHGPSTGTASPAWRWPCQP